jgi:hypothetical protein
MRRDELLGGVRQILLTQWDPCSVGDNPKLADEYDSYARGIADVLLLSSPSASSLTAILEDAESELGVALPAEQRLRIAHRLLSLL